MTGMLAALAGRIRSFARRISLFELWVAVVALLASILLPAVQHCMFLAGQVAAARGKG